MSLSLLEAWGEALCIDIDGDVTTPLSTPTPNHTKESTMTVMTNTEPWWADHNNISFLLEYLNGPRNTTEYILDVDLALHVVEKPWHWTEEYEMALAQYETETGAS